MMLDGMFFEEISWEGHSLVEVMENFCLRWKIATIQHPGVMLLIQLKQIQSVTPLLEHKMVLQEGIEVKEGKCFMSSLSRKISFRDLYYHQRYAAWGWDLIIAFV